MKPVWSNLPNAKYIDQILLSLKINPEMWIAVRGAARDAARVAAWDAATGRAAREEAWVAARDAAWEEVRYAAWDAAKDAILALIAYDRTGSLFNLPPDQVKILAALGDQAAILVESAVRSLNKNNV
jgi:hypothetical protein